MQKKYVCTFEGCAAAFMKSDHFKSHMRTHTGEKPFACTYQGCEAKFARSDYLKSHMRTHTGEKPFACTYEGCDASFTQSSHLMMHMRTHTGDKPYVCTFEDCNASFAQSGDLKRHLCTHTGEKPFACTFEDCNASFAQCGDLKKHLRTHTGEKPYTCMHEGCQCSFTTSDGLKLHMRMHTGEKPFCCTYKRCDAAFARSGDLKTHLRTHTGEKPFTCTFESCESTFGQRSHLTKHIRAMHSLEGQARQKKQEQRIANVLDAAGIDYKREHKIDFTCMGDADNSYARIDFVFMRFGRVIFLEVDEEQHRFGYGKTMCDMKRMTKIIESLCLEGNSMKIVFIRYNPNTFTVDYQSRNVIKKTRERTLVDMLQDDRNAIFTTKMDVTIQYMYYDTVSEYADITYDPEYNKYMRECCLPTIV